MLDLAKIVMDKPSMTSVEIANLLNASHEAVVSVIKEISKEGVISPSKELDKGYYFEGDKGLRDCIVVMTRFEPKMISSIIKRMEYIKQEIAKSKLVAEEDRRSRKLYYKMEDTIRGVNKAASKADIERETDLIHKMVFGVTEGEYREKRSISPDSPIRDLMPRVVLETIADLEGINISLIKIGMEYKERKAKLEAHYMKKHNQKLIDAYTKSDDLV